MNRLPNHLLTDPAYLSAAERLEKQGYQSIKQTEGIFPLLFRRGSGKQMLYLFRAALDGRNSYKVEWTEENVLVPVDFLGAHRPTLRIPRALYQAPTRELTRYYWLPRKREQAPPVLAGGMMTKQDVSELLGLALSTVQSAITDKTNPLPVTSALNNAPLFRVDDVLTWNDLRLKGQRARKGDTYEKAYRSLNKEALLKRILHDLSLGRITEVKLFTGAMSMYGQLVRDTDALIAYLSQLSRSDVLLFMSEVGILTALPEQKKKCLLHAPRIALT